MKNIRVGYYKRRDGKFNFGDDLSPLLISNLLKANAEHSNFITADILGIGSILNFWKFKGNRTLRNILHNFTSHNPIAIWGAGLISPTKIFLPNHDILAVRGPLTAKYLGLKSLSVFGDPGILAPDLVSGEQKTGLIGIIPHYVDKNNPIVKKLPNDEGLKIIDVESHCVTVLKEISRCDYIVSSSLHGLICADAYGIPNVRITLSDKIRGGDFKYEDYCFGIERKPFHKYHINNIGEFMCLIRDLRNISEVARIEKIEQKSKELRSRLQEWGDKYNFGNN